MPARRADLLRNKNSTSTPETKLNSTNFSSGREARGNSVQIDYKRKRMSYKHENEDNDTFITSTDYHNQMTAMDERLTKLEELVRSLYEKLNFKIDAEIKTLTSNSNEIVNQIAQQLGDEINDLREDLTLVKNNTNFIRGKEHDDEGYEASEDNID